MFNHGEMKVQYMMCCLQWLNISLIVENMLFSEHYVVDVDVNDVRLSLVKLKLPLS